MPIKIEGIMYYSVSDVHREFGITRQTLWRWRKDGNIPQGRRYRGRQIVFTKPEIEVIREHANRLEPAELSNVSMLKRLKSSPRKRNV